MRNIGLVLSYDGSEFFGWQFQKKDSQPTVQGELNKAIAKLQQEPFKPPSGIGRTDRGAHAMAYNANFLTSNRSIPAEKFALALNTFLPRSIRILRSYEAPAGFDARFSALAREYVYVVLTSPKPHPVFRAYAHFLEHPSDIVRLQTVTKVFRGEHDFRRFASGLSRSKVKTSVREIFYFRAAELPGRIVFTIKGNGFLQGMIRTLVSVCLNYADGKLTLDQIRGALDHGERLPSKYCAPVPASGLYFKRGYYCVA
ncbi:MAG: tRNA pseudouridine(38-40) synthase TruA [Spirochaetes bacterium GWF1_51_8]|nr:MAG: tRNA pseudouridine(38-40) synthase TruA [Spirochaetes bacterium GWF1_51_8]